LRETTFTEELELTTLTVTILMEKRIDRDKNDMIWEVNKWETWRIKKCNFIN